MAVTSVASIALMEADSWGTLRHAPTATGTITSSAPRAGFVGDPETGWYCHPTIVDGVRPGDALYDTETFGPLVGVGRFTHLDEAIELANGHGYGLSSAIYTSDPLTAFRFREGGEVQEGRGRGTVAGQVPPLRVDVQEVHVAADVPPAFPAVVAGQERVYQFGIVLIRVPEQLPQHPRPQFGHLGTVALVRPLLEQPAYAVLVEEADVRPERELRLENGPE